MWVKMWIRRYWESIFVNKCFCYVFCEKQQIHGTLWNFVRKELGSTRKDVEMLPEKCSLMKENKQYEYRKLEERLRRV